MEYRADPDVIISLKVLFVFQHILEIEKEVTLLFQTEGL